MRGNGNLAVPPSPNSTILSPIIWYVWKEVNVKKKPNPQGKFHPLLVPFAPLHIDYMDGHVILQCLYATIHRIAFTTGNEKGRGEVSIQI